MQIEIPDQIKLKAALINNVGVAVAREGGDAVYTAIAMLRRAVALNPLDLGHRLNLASYLLEHGNDDESEEIATFALKHDERAATAWQVLGVISTNHGRIGEAIDRFKRAYEIEPNNGQRKFDLAAAYMRAGDFAKGLPFYEYRHEILPRTGSPPNAPTWKGEKTGHLAIWPDQGHGDLMMFGRFVPWAKERADKITFMINPHLLGLFQGYAQIEGVKVESIYPTDTKFDHQICVASLPLIYGLSTDNIPPDPHLLSTADTLGRLPGDGLRIGIAWQGNTQFPGDRMRSIPFREFLPLVADPRNTVYSLQVGPASADIAKARAQRVVRDMADQLEGEWCHTAALIKNLDLVVSSCTAIPHLAGALDVPTFIMIPQFADWRWLHGRDDTPWYPNTRLFRQTRAGEWKSVMDRVLKAIGEVHRARDLQAMIKRGCETLTNYEPEVTSLMRRVLRPGDTFVDVGANIGRHTVTAARLVGETGQVIAIEPGSNALPSLRLSVANMPQVRIVDQPAWQAPGEVTFYLSADESGSNAMWDPGEWPGPHNPRSKEIKQPVAMLATTLDRECHYGDDPRPSPRLIKIDTEGAEQRILQGAVNLLMADNRPPFIVAELHELGLAKLGCSQASLRALMQSYGYSAFFLFADGMLPQLVPPNTVIKGGLIMNLLFSTPEAVGEAWSDQPIEIRNLHPFWAYGATKEAASAA